MWKTTDRKLYLFLKALNAMQIFMKELKNLILRRSPIRNEMWILVKTKRNNPCVP